MSAERRFVRSFVSSKKYSKSWTENKENVPLLGPSPHPHFPSTLSSALIRPRNLVRRRPPPIAAHRFQRPQIQRRLDNVHMADSEPPHRLHHAKFIADPSTSSLPLILPRHLERPEFRPIEPAAIAAVDPVLNDIPLAYIRHSLREIGPKLLECANKARAILITTGELPSHLDVICGDSTVEPPSHIIAVHADGCETSQVTFFPVHALAVVTGCANLPILPPSHQKGSASEGEIVRVPVVPIQIPSVSMFPPLLSYLYTDRYDTLLSALLPFEDDGQEFYASIGRRHAKSFSVKELLNDARKVHALWSNATALGVFDDMLYNALEMAWEVCLTALSDGYQKHIEDGIDVSGAVEP